MFNKRLFTILLVLFGIFFFAGCSSSTDTTADTTDTDEMDSTLATEIIGTWKSENEVGPITTDDGEEITGSVTYTYTFDAEDGVKLETKQVLNSNGDTEDTYDYTTTGTYEIDGEDVYITMNEENATNENEGTTEDEVNTNTVAMQALTKESQLNKPGEPTVHKVTIDGDEMTMTNSVGEFTFTKSK